MELSAPTLLLLLLPVISMMIFVSLLRRESRSSKRRPPGPRRLPFIGSLHHLLTSEPHVALRDLAKKHGPVMYLQLGQVNAAVISSPAAAQEVLRDNNLTFASRPSILSAEITSYGNLDIAFAPYGAYWRTLRKLCAVELLSARKVRQFGAIRDSETMSLVKKVREASSGGKPVNLGRLVVSCANAITAKAAFGEGCEAELQVRFLRAMQVMLAFSGKISIRDIFPSLWFVDVLTGVRRRLWRLHWQLDAILEEIIDGCEARREMKKTTTATTRDDDLLSVMLGIKEDGDLGFHLGRKNIKAITLDLFTAGTDTTSSTVEWIMSQLMKNPEVMTKAQAEVRQTLDNKSPEDHDAYMEKLCYTKMVIKEGLRLHPPVPLMVPRVCRETCDVGGFEIVAGSRVIVNVWAIGRSPEHWHDDADEFRPERFNDSAAPDYNGTDYKYLPFGSGRRICPGVNFGLAAVELIVARLLYCQMSLTWT